MSTINPQRGYELSVCEETGSIPNWVDSMVQTLLSFHRRMREAGGKYTVLGASHGEFWLWLRL